MTDFTTRCDILAQLWIFHRETPQFRNLIEYSDIALPIAYCVSTDVVKPTVIAESFINETWDLLLAHFDLEDSGFDSLEDLFAISEMGED